MFSYFLKQGHPQIHRGLESTAGDIFHWSVASQDANVPDVLTRGTSVKEKHISILCAGRYFPVLETRTSLLLYLMSIYRIQAYIGDIVFRYRPRDYSEHHNKVSCNLSTGGGRVLPSVCKIHNICEARWSEGCLCILGFTQVAIRYYLNSSIK